MSNTKIKLKKQPQSEKLINLNELASVLGFGTTFINKAKNSMGLPFYKIGGAVRFKMSDVNEWIEQRKVIL